MTVAVEEIVCRCLAERREEAVKALVRALDDIALLTPDKEPKPQPGSDYEPLLAYEDGDASGRWELGKIARAALEEWERQQ